MHAQTAELIAQLNTLLRLTAHEAATARSRVAQATTDQTRKELTDNARNSDRRADSLRQAVRDLGGAPDMVGVALGKASAAAKLPLEQTMPITEALLADLALEHQLFDRARLVKVLAHAADAADTVALAERLEDAHGETIEWLFTVLAETALGGPAALAPTPLQAVATTARTAATFAGSAAATGLNRAALTVGNMSERVQDTSISSVGRIVGLATSARKIVTAGRDATLAETENQAAERGSEVRSTVHQVRAGLGALSAAELPIEDFDLLTAKDAIAAISGLGLVEQVRVVLAYEQAHKKRQSVVEAADKRSAELAKELVNN
ncbi:MAG: ferritin-like domain-containing protein [Actinobacteria bacterium]|nr:ferritin-like domain-containing protein [Actinomycetota bacterium]MBW3647356.1 ferritin-like domain-containing protein [Actinomycetota bacterium]